MTGREDWTNEDTTALFEAIITLDDVGDAEKFFRDLCTLRELEGMSQRWAIARLLSQGLPYRQVAEQAGSSTATVTRISHWLRHGPGGYRMMLDRFSTPGRKR